MGNHQVNIKLPVLLPVKLPYLCCILLRALNGFALREINSHTLPGPNSACSYKHPECYLFIDQYCFEYLKVIGIKISSVHNSNKDCVDILNLHDGGNEYSQRLLGLSISQNEGMLNKIHLDFYNWILLLV